MKVEQDQYELELKNRKDEQKDEPLNDWDENGVIVGGDSPTYEPTEPGYDELFVRVGDEDVENAYWGMCNTILYYCPSKY